MNKKEFRQALLRGQGRCLRAARGDPVQARASGLCGRIAAATVRHLERLRYPADIRGRVSFASRKTIDNTPGGPRMCFQ